ncbi:hypothetical protein [Winkia sp. UMB0889B]|uniref:hypothetical protein n=1 Tax=Winkia sp. UMB0889B TaxID=3046315 RepID=UPI0025552033|nr:hypothetical protein [Winkia sp. UMB0889B]MDK7904855.1 hypothetical protein [Winkia sp. UMB0889B]
MKWQKQKDQAAEDSKNYTANSNRPAPKPTPHAGYAANQLITPPNQPTKPTAIAFN